MEVCNIRPMSSSFLRCAITKLVCCTPCSVSSWKTSIPPRAGGPCHTAVAVMRLIPILERKVGKYLACICEHCFLVKHVAPSGYWIIVCQIALKPMPMCSHPRGAVLILWFISFACIIRYRTSSLSLPSGARRTPRVRWPWEVLMHWIMVGLSVSAPDVRRIGGPLSVVCVIFGAPVGVKVHSIPYQKHFDRLSAPPVA